MTRHYCTYFDHRYLPRGVAMFESLRAVAPSSELWVLCLSEECHATLQALALPGLHCIPLSELEAADPELLRAKSNRSKIEYFFTCSPCLPRYLLRSNPGIELITYLDSDLYFFSSPEAIFAEIGDRSVAIIEHRFVPRNKWMLKNGRFNVGWLSFRNNPQGGECLDWWRTSCIDWCYDRVEPTRFADQKYLDQFPNLFPEVAIISHPGANSAAWNIERNPIHSTKEGLKAGSGALIFFHFQGVRRLSRWVVDPNVQWFGIRLSVVMEMCLYRPYLAHIERVRTRVGTTHSVQSDLVALARAHDLENQARAVEGTRQHVIDWIANVYRQSRGVLARRFMLHRGR